MRYVLTDRELERWVTDGLVSAEQAQAIRARTGERTSDERRTRIVQTLAVVGAIVAGLGVLLFFAANWDAIARPVRVALLLALLLASYAGGYALRHNHGRGRHQGIGGALLLLGGIVFGASLFLVGQMYHVQAHDPLAFLLWTLGVVPTAVVLRSRPLAILGLLTFGGWLVYEAIDVGGDDGAGYALVALTLYGVALYGAGTSVAQRLEPLDLAGPMRALGYALVSLGTFVFTFRGFFDPLDERQPLGGTVGLGLAALSLAAAAAAGFVLLAPSRHRRTAVWEALILGLVTAGVLAAVLVPEQAGVDGDDAIVYPLLFNVLAAALALGAVLVGYANDERWLVNAGIAFVAIDVFARYIDLFWDMLPRSIVFIGAGAVILVLAFGLERQRSRLLARMEAS